MEGMGTIGARATLDPQSDWEGAADGLVFTGLGSGIALLWAPGTVAGGAILGTLPGLTIFSAGTAGFSATVPDGLSDFESIPLAGLGETFPSAGMFLKICCCTGIASAEDEGGGLGEKA
jgi:hypothetical protein